jgi:hypothetical protein
MFTLIPAIIIIVIIIISDRTPSDFFEFVYRSFSVIQKNIRKLLCSWAASHGINQYSVGARLSEATCCWQANSGYELFIIIAAIIIIKE